MLSPLVPRRAPGARVVAAVGALDLDHVGAEVAQQHRGERPGEHAREVGDEDPFQRRHGGHTSAPPCGRSSSPTSTSAGPEHNDLLRRADLRAPLLEALEDVDRLVILGDGLELREAAHRDAMETAAPFFADVGAALGPDKELILLAGNHDHGIAAGWIDARLQSEPSGFLGLEQRFAPDEAGPLAQRLAEAARPARLQLAYPGIWLRDDVYAIHGHYADVHATVPTFERLAAGAMARFVAKLPAARRDRPTTTRRSSARSTPGCTRSRSAPTTPSSASAAAPRPAPTRSSPPRTATSARSDARARHRLPRRGRRAQPRRPRPAGGEPLAVSAAPRLPARHQGGHRAPRHPTPST